MILSNSLRDAHIRRQLRRAIIKVTTEQAELTTLKVDLLLAATLPKAAEMHGVHGSVVTVTDECCALCFLIVQAIVNYALNLLELQSHVVDAVAALTTTAPKSILLISRIN